MIMLSIKITYFISSTLGSCDPTPATGAEQPEIELRPGGAGFQRLSRPPGINPTPTSQHHPPGAPQHHPPGAPPPGFVANSSSR